MDSARARDRSVYFLCVFTMPNSPFKKLAKAADGTGLSAGLSGASSDEGIETGGPGEGVDPGDRKSVLKRGGLEQGVPKIARVQKQSVGSVDASAGLGVTLFFL